jgi:ATP-dependent helicase/nuclease subunit A
MLRDRAPALPRRIAAPVRAGDFLILVRRRSALFHEVIRACKAAGLPSPGPTG